MSQGLTSVHEMGIDRGVADVYLRLARDGRLKIRVYAHWSRRSRRPSRRRSGAVPCAPVPTTCSAFGPSSSTRTERWAHGEPTSRRLTPMTRTTPGWS